MYILRKVRSASYAIDQSIKYGNFIRPISWRTIEDMFGAIFTLKAIKENNGFGREYKFIAYKHGEKLVYCPAFFPDDFLNLWEILELKDKPNESV